MRVQLWSYNYDPEPSGIGPLSATAARALAAAGHEIEVVAAHPHYPEPRWGRALRPRSEALDGIRVLRLPLWVGRASAAQRIRQEASFALALSAATPTLGTPDVVLAVSPSFPALAVAMANARIRRVPWVLWLQDILPDGATATGILREGRLIALARRLERAAYHSAAHIIVISDSFADNLAAKGVPRERMTRIYNPATREIASSERSDSGDGMTVMTMGNVGHTQNLAQVTRAFERSDELARLGARFVIVGDGVAGDEVRAAIETDRVRVTGFVDDARLERELATAKVAVVSQRYDGVDFNVPSKLANFMARGLPVVAAVRAESEVARIVRASGGGWVVDAGDGERFASVVAGALRDSDERGERGRAALRFAQENFDPDRLAADLERVLASASASGGHSGRSSAA